jgi:DNA invertase Pin-like site-specific DNA recombinase
MPKVLPIISDRPDRLMKTKRTFVYFARAHDTGLIKIGYSANPDARASALSTEVGDQVQILFTVNGNRVKESGYHKRFAVCLARGKEWFYETGRLHDFLKGRGYGGTKTVFQKEFIQGPATTLVIEVLKHGGSGETGPIPQLIGYARVSTDDQNLDVQLAALRQVGVREEHMFIEKVSAVNAKRPQFNLLMKFLETGDTLLIHALSRLGRNNQQIHGILAQLETLGVSWRSITEPHLNTATATGRLMLNITGAMAQFERDQIVDRTKRGMDELRRKGMYLGRPRLVNDADIEKMQELRDAGVDVKKIAKRYKVKISTVYSKTKKPKSKAA